MFTGDEMSEDVHVVPVNDLREHDDSRVCLCRPRVEAIGGGVVVIHNSYDGREITEVAADHAFNEGVN